jgi:hypothetical protein
MSVEQPMWPSVMLVCAWHTNYDLGLPMSGVLPFSKRRHVSGLYKSLASCAIAALPGRDCPCLPLLVNGDMSQAKAILNSFTHCG